MALGYVRHQPTVGGISEKSAGGERQAEEKEKRKEEGESKMVALPALGGLIEQGRGFIGRMGDLFGGAVGIQRAYRFKVDIGKGVKDSFDGVVR